MKASTDKVDQALQAKAICKAEEEIANVIDSILKAVSIKTINDDKMPSPMSRQYGRLKASDYDHHYQDKESKEFFNRFADATNSFILRLKKERATYLHSKMVADLLEKIQLIG